LPVAKSTAAHLFCLLPDGTRQHWRQNPGTSFCASTIWIYIITHHVITHHSLLQDCKFLGDRDNVFQLVVQQIAQGLAGSLHSINSSWIVMIWQMFIECLCQAQFQILRDKKHFVS
jgi:predicted SprT family Zn-dependent metalloprotease